MICCSFTCEKRKQCGRWAPISEDLYPNGGTVEPLDKFGSGNFYIDKYGKTHCEERYWCGKNGNYKMFVQAKNSCPDNVDYVYDGATGTIKKVEK